MEVFTGEGETLRRQQMNVVFMRRATVIRLRRVTLILVLPQIRLTANSMNGMNGQNAVAAAMVLCIELVSLSNTTQEEVSTVKVQQKKCKAATPLLTIAVNRIRLIVCSVGGTKNVHALQLVVVDRLCLSEAF